MCNLKDFDWTNTCLKTSGSCLKDTLRKGWRMFPLWSSIGPWQCPQVTGGRLHSNKHMTIISWVPFLVLLIKPLSTLCNALTKKIFYQILLLKKAQKLLAYPSFHRVKIYREFSIIIGITTTGYEYLRPEEYFIYLMDKYPQKEVIHVQEMHAGGRFYQLKLVKCISR